MATPPVKITKVDDEAPSMSGVTTEQPSTAGKRKSLKTFPRGILKTAKHRPIALKPVADPAKSPPIKKSMKKHTIRILTDKGIRHHRKTIKQKISKMSDEKVKSLVMKAGILKNPNTPVPMMREMLEGGMIAGFISSD